MVTGCQPLSTPCAVDPGRTLRRVRAGPIGSPPTCSLLFSLTKQRLINERHLTQYQPTVTDYRAHRRTVLPAREINLKACAPGIRTRNLPAGPGLNPAPPMRTVPPEPSRQVYFYVIFISSSSSSVFSRLVACRLIFTDIISSSTGPRFLDVSTETQVEPVLVKHF